MPYDIKRTSLVHFAARKDNSARSEDGRPLKNDGLPHLCYSGRKWNILYPSETAAWLF